MRKWLCVVSLVLVSAVSVQADELDDLRRSLEEIKRSLNKSKYSPPSIRNPIYREERRENRLTGKFFTRLVDVKPTVGMQTNFVPLVQNRIDPWGRPFQVPVVNQFGQQWVTPQNRLVYGIQPVYKTFWQIKTFDGRYMYECDRDKCIYRFCERTDCFFKLPDKEGHKYKVNAGFKVTPNR